MLFLNLCYLKHNIAFVLPYRSLTSNSVQNQRSEDCLSLHCTARCDSEDLREESSPTARDPTATGCDLLPVAVEQKSRRVTNPGNAVQEIISDGAKGETYVFNRFLFPKKLTPGKGTSGAKNTDYKRFPRVCSPAAAAAPSSSII